MSLDTLDGDWTFGYDAVGQLISAAFASETAEIADTTITYEYDAAGNRTRVVEDGVEALYEANTLNQYTRVGDATFAYDADGNMTLRTDGEGTTTYAYDLDNRLVGVTQADGTELAFEYDVFGNRVAKTVDGERTEYLVDPFGLGDVVGSVTGLTDASGALVNRYAYTPFGEELLEVEGLANAYEFNGLLGVAEDADDLTFMRARSYSVDMGRFITEDPYFFAGDPTNLYSFSFNNPASFSDPTGEIPLLVVATLWSLAPSAGAVGYGYAAAATGAAVVGAAVTAYGAYSTVKYADKIHRRWCKGLSRDLRRRQRLGD